MSSEPTTGTKEILFYTVDLPPQKPKRISDVVEHVEPASDTGLRFRTMDEDTAVIARRIADDIIGFLQHTGHYGGHNLPGYEHPLSGGYTIDLNDVSGTERKPREPIAHLRPGEGTLTLRLLRERDEDKTFLHTYAQRFPQRPHATE